MQRSSLPFSSNDVFIVDPTPASLIGPRQIFVSPSARRWLERMTGALPKTLGELESSHSRLAAALSHQVAHIATTPLLMEMVEVDGMHFSSDAVVDENGDVRALFVHGPMTLDDSQKLRKHIEDVEKKNEQLISFSHSVSHTLKNDWQAVGLIIDEIFGLIEVSEEEGQAPPLDEILDFLRDLRPRATKGFHTVVDLLAYAQAGAKPHLQRQLLLPMVQRVVQRVNSKTISIVEDFPEVDVDIDPDMFPIALLQVVENAVKYGEGKPVLIDYAPGSLRVRDNGRGIPLDKIAEIFDTFKRAATDLPGTGLGLSIAKQIVEAHGYSIIARSAGPGAGSEFFIHFSPGAS